MGSTSFLSEPVWDSPIDAAKFETYCDHQRVITLLMALHDRFEPVRVILLYRNLLSTFNEVITELLSEETGLSTRSHNINNVIAAYYPKPATLQRHCSYYYAIDHSLLHCPVQICRHCHK